METRRLVKTGAETYTISLPKQWVKQNKLNKGDLLFLKELGNKVELSTEAKDEKEKKEATITIDKKDVGSIRRETISAYINNSTEFVFIGDGLSKKLEDIRKILHNFLALEVVEQTQTKLVVKDYLDLKEFSLDNTLRRMDMLIKSIIADSKNALKEKGVSKSLVYRDYEVDKLFFLISRLVRSREIESKEAIEYWWMAKNLENIGDMVRDLSEKFEKLGDDFILELYDKIEEYYREAIKSHFSKDKKVADKLIANRPALLDEIDDAIEDKEIANKLKSIVNRSRNIAKIVLDS